MIDTLSTETSDALLITNDSKMEDYEIYSELTIVISCIVQQCSEEIFQVCLLFSYARICFFYFVSYACYRRWFEEK